MVMASAGHDQDSCDHVTLICTESNENPDNFDEIMISIDEMSTWDLPSILAHRVLRIEVDRNRLIEGSSYFRGLLGGSFSESRLSSISIHWNLKQFVSVLMAIFGCHVEIHADNFIPLNQVALFFGVDALILKCRVWLDEVTSFRELQSPRLCLDGLILIWKYGLEHANEFILQLCTSYLARNFMWALSFNSYIDIPEKLLHSCIQHPDLTVDSERHLCDAILLWLIAKTEKSEGWSSIDICHEIRATLLPLWFAAGKQRCRFFSMFADKAIDAILCLSRPPCMSLTDIIREGDLSRLQIRLTKYTQKLDVSSCPQITERLLLLSVLPSCDADSLLKTIKKASGNHAYSGKSRLQISQSLGQSLTFEAVQELDISNCPSLSLESAIDFFCKLCPSLRTLRAAYYLNFKTIKLCQLVQRFPRLTNIDLTLDTDPVVPSQVSVITSSSVLETEGSTAYFDTCNCRFASSRPLLSNIKTLALEGRTDISDSDLLVISEVCCSLTCVNMKRCTSVTDHGLSVMVLKCKMLESVLVCDTSFGNKSIMALCWGVSSEMGQAEKQSQLVACKLLTLHIGGCHGISGQGLSELMSGAVHLRSLCLREIQLVDDALYSLSGGSLEMLDVSDTKVSSAALYHVIHKNPDLGSLKTRGCRNLIQLESETEERNVCSSSYSPGELYSELGKSCKLEEIELGWGFSLFSLRALKPAITTLRTLVVGLGGTLGHDGLKLLPTICPLLETLILYFQAISDSIITDVMRTLPHLQILGLCYCFGDISSLSFMFNMSNLRSLQLERVTPWMTNVDLANLAENCANLVRLTLIGCKLLDSETQAIISSGWPGLASLHLEECGEITGNGVGSLLDCHALEDLVLRHNGPGISRNFIIYAASKLPMLRKISLDICDAREGDFDIPSFGNRYFLSSVKIARCKLQKSTFGHNLQSPVHKESLVLVWNSEKLTRTLVKERL